MITSSPPPRVRVPFSKATLIKRIIVAGAVAAGYAALNFGLFRSSIAEAMFSFLVVWVPVDLVILFRPEWIDKYFRWYEERKRLYREGR